MIFSYKQVVFKTLISFALLLPFSCIAQSVISGRILNQADNKPIPNVTVFLDNASIGGTTAADGTFILRNAQPGKYELVTSCVGFETYRQNIIVSNADLILPAIFIGKKTITLAEVSVRVSIGHSITRDNFDWPKYYGQFKEELFGTTDLANECDILNPEMIKLSYGDEASTLYASSDDFIIIENKALGYKIKYLLTNFSRNTKDTLNRNKKVTYSGSALFEELKGTPAQERRWQARRAQAYEGSAMHFFRSALGNRLENDGFRVLRWATYQNPDKPDSSLIAEKIKFFKDLKSKTDSQKDSLAYWNKKSKLPKIIQKLISSPLSGTDLVRLTNQKGSYTFGCDFDNLYISYDKNHHYPAISPGENLDKPGNEGTTLVRFNSPFAFFGVHGGISNTNSLTYTGVWGRKRLAGLLPFDYGMKQDNNDEIKVDSTVANNVFAKIKSFETGHVVEKAYLHFDKPYYATGDTIYFKAYVTAGEQHELSQLSGVLHVDLINNFNRVNQSIKLQIIDGVGWGDFALPDSLAKGQYQIRAYTQLMRNESEDGFFHQSISIGSLKKAPVIALAAKHAAPASITVPAQQVNIKPDTRFFPEGGSLVAGIRSKVAFKAITQNGVGINVRGVVVDDENKEILSFASTHLGMGSFYLDPKEGKSYKAKLTYPNGLQDMVELPKPEAKGIVLSVDDSLHFATIKVHVNQAYYRENRDKNYTLVVYSGGEAIPTIFKLDSSVYTTDIFKEKMRMGIARITLFSPTGEPLNERLLFIKNHDQLKLDVSSDKVVYAKREKVSIKVSPTNKDGMPVGGYFSVSVIDQNKVPSDINAASTIINNLLFTSDLTGYIEKPNYYFADNSDKTNSGLDLVMLTHGYRSFEWKKIMGEGYPAMAYQAEKGLEITGSAKTPSGKPLANQTITLIPERGSLFTQTTDASGNFRFTGLVFADTARFMLNAMNANGKPGGLLTYNREIPATVNINKNWFDEQDTTASAYLQNRKKQMDDEARYGTTNGTVLKEVKIKDKKKKDDDYRSTSLAGPGHADKVLHSEDLENMGGLLSQIIALRVPGVTFVDLPAPGYPTPKGLVERGVPYLNTASKDLMGPISMLLVYNGLVMPDNTGVDFINPGDVETIEVLKFGGSASVYGSRASGGVLVITTKMNGGSKSNEKAPGSLPIHANGFYKARQFYAPKYEHVETTPNHKDLRPTIYWNPFLVTDKNGNISFDYYNADGTGNYLVVIEGIDLKGNLGTTRYTYKVQ